MSNNLNKTNIKILTFPSYATKCKRMLLNFLKLSKHFAIPCTVSGKDVNL